MVVFPSLHRVRGFTLVEVMITIAIIAILASFAVPSYLDHLRKGKRGQAKADMVEISQQLERRYTTDRDYTKASTFCGKTLPSPATGTVIYQVTPVCTASTYTITATPRLDQIKDRCGTMTLKQTGAKTPTLAGCW